MKIEIKKLTELPIDLLDLLKKEFEEEEIDLDSLDDVIEYIKGYGDYEKSTDSCYINYDYFCDLGKWRLYAYGSCYLKDHSICDEEMSDIIEIEDRELAKSEKANKKAEKAKENSDKWLELIKTKSPEELLKFILDNKIDFPKGK